MRVGLGLWILLVLAVSCRNNDAKPKREQCIEALDHVADLIVDHALADPETLWDALHAEPGDPGFPATTTKQTFAAYLASPAGKTWVSNRRARTREGTRAGIEQCIQASAAQISCMLAAKTRADVEACDRVE